MLAANPKLFIFRWQARELERIYKKQQRSSKLEREYVVHNKSDKASMLSGRRKNNRTTRHVDRRLRSDHQRLRRASIKKKRARGNRHH